MDPAHRQKCGPAMKRADSMLMEPALVVRCLVHGPPAPDLPHHPLAFSPWHCRTRPQGIPALRARSLLAAGARQCSTVGGRRRLWRSESGPGLPGWEAREERSLRDSPDVGAGWRRSPRLIQHRNSWRRLRRVLGKHSHSACANDYRVFRTAKWTDPSRAGLS